MVAQNRMKQQADRHRREKEFEVGEWVYLRLQPYRQMSLAARQSPKLAARYYGPFEVLARVGKVAYRLKLPPKSQIHPVFHMSQLKQSPPSAEHATPEAPMVGSEGEPLAGPAEILERRTTKRGRKEIQEVLVRWYNLPPESATWEELSALLARYPDFTT